MPHFTIGKVYIAGKEADIRIEANNEEHANKLASHMSTFYILRLEVGFAAGNARMIGGKLINNISAVPIT